MAGVTSKGVETEDKEAKDRISELPDELCHHILSFLPIEDAVKTAILSKNWVSTWTTMPELTFDDSELIPNFEIFVENFMSLHVGRITKFSMHSTERHYLELILGCISTAVMRDVSELNIRLNGLEHHVPDCIYTCGSLEDLKICGWLSTLKVPDNRVVALKRLKRLSLAWAGIEEESYMATLLSGCPVLEELHIHELNLRNLSRFSVCSISLKRLTVNMLGGVPGSVNCRLSIDVPNLEYLTIMENVMPLAENFFQNQASSIVSASLHIGFTGPVWLQSPVYYFGNSPPIPAVKLLNYISGTLTRLWLSYHTLKHIGGGYQWNHLAMFNKLEHLLLEVKTNATSDYWSVVHCLLERSPTLTSLALIGTGRASYSEWYEPDTIAVCLSSNLEILKVKGFDGGEGEMKLIEYFLRNALKLKRMAISSDNFPAEEKESLLEKLAAEFTWGSSNCLVTFR